MKKLTTTLKISLFLKNLGIYRRLSPYIAYGNISIEQFGKNAKGQSLTSKTRCLSEINTWQTSSYYHFIQKFETDPRLEFKNMNPAFDNIREKKINTISMPGKRVGQVIPWSMPR